jgi:hypothetical protein
MSPTYPARDAPLVMRSSLVSLLAGAALSCRATSASPSQPSVPTALPSAQPG